MKGNVILQELQAIHLEAYYRKKGEKLSQTTLEHHHAIISGALKSAQRKNYCFVSSMASHFPAYSLPSKGTSSAAS